MTSHYQYYKDTLKQFDTDAQALQEEINRLYAELGKVQSARLQFQRMHERVFGEPEQTIVMQHTGFIERRIQEAQQLAPPIKEALGPADDGEASRRAKYGEAAERKRLRDHNAYLRRKERQKRKRPSGPTWVNKVLAFVREAGEPVRYRDIINYHGGDANEVVIKSAISALKKQGLIQNLPGLPTGTGNVAQYVPTERGRVTPINLTANGAAHP